MPISPRQARQAKEASEALEFLAACSDIDAYLKLASDPAYWDCRRLSASLRARVIAAYTAVGWVVEFIPDQRDGDCLKFSERVRR
jgi:hypothetical protein